MGFASVKPDLKEAVRRAAAELGFAACRFTTAGTLDCGALLRDWLEAGRHGDMDYLSGDLSRRLDPKRTLAGAASVIVTAWPYQAPAPAPDWRENLCGRIAAYTLGIDYHEELRAKLEDLAETIRSASGLRGVCHVDAGPLVEKELARQAGIGWYGRNTNILSKNGGSYFLIACLLSEYVFVPDPPFIGDHCGDCTACVPACPTGALDSGPTIDARRCISYLTIEHRGPIDPRLRAGIGNWVFGCDICQEVCPWNPAAKAPDAFLNPPLVELLEMSESEYRERYRRSAVRRCKRRGLARNAAVALGNSANLAAVEALERAACEHDETLVRSHSVWGLGRLRGPNARKALEHVASRPQLPPVLREIEAARAPTRQKLPPSSSSRTKPRSILE